MGIAGTAVGVATLISTSMPEVQRFTHAGQLGKQDTNQRRKVERE